MANTFINRLVTKIEFQGASQFSNLLFGVGRGFDHLQQRAAVAAKKVQEANEVVSVAHDDLRLLAAQRNVAQGAFAAQQGKVAALKAAMPQGPSPAQIAQAARVASSDLAKKQKAEFDRNNQILKVQSSENEQKAARRQLTYLRNYMGALQRSGAPEHQILKAKENLYKGRDVFAQAGLNVEAQRQALTFKDQAVLAAQNKYGASQARYMGMLGQPGPTKAQIDALKQAEKDLIAVEKQLVGADKAYAASLKQSESAVKQLKSATDAQIAADLELAEAQKAARRGLIIGGAIALASTVFLFGKAAAQAAIEFETLQAQLDFLFKSSERGKQAMRWAQDFARRTPFDVQQVVGAFRDLAVFGLQPTAQRMRALGALASLFRRDFSDAVKAVGFGLEGNFSRLQRGFAITRAQIQAFQNLRHGPKLFDNAGKIINRQALEKALFDFIDKKYGGAMEKMEHTTAVHLSNVADAWKIFLASVGRGELGPINDVSNMLINSLTWMTNNIPNVTILWNDLSKGIITVAEAMAEVLKYSTYLNPATAFLGPSVSFRKMMDDFIGGAEDRIKELNQSNDRARKAMNNPASKEPPVLPKSGLGTPGTMGGMSQIVREILGGLGDAAKFQIKASELPGRNDRNIAKKTFALRWAGPHGSIDDNILNLIYNLLSDMERHGAVNFNTGAS